MAFQVVKIVFPDRVRYGIYWSYSGKILDWVDLDSLLEKRDLPKEIAEQLGCDGTALLSTDREANLVKEALERS